MVTSVGLTAQAACAAIRAKISNPTETRFIDATGKWITAQSVGLEKPWTGREKLVQMAASAIQDCLADTTKEDWPDVPLILCVAERGRPGRTQGLDDLLFNEIQVNLGVEFARQSMVIPQGRVSSTIALRHARQMLRDGGASMVLIVATDSLLNWQTISAYERGGRLLTEKNSNGFIPGEGACAVLIGPKSPGLHLMIEGLGFATEPATISREEPLLGIGLAQAIKEALREAECNLDELDFRVSDLSGEQYYFKEAALGLARNLRKHKERMEMWHPAESIGEAGAVSGLAPLAIAEAACRKGYSPGFGALWHAANDGGQRAAAVLRYRVT